MDDKKKCLLCKIIFIPRKKEQKFCSKVCYLNSIRKKRIQTVCAWCGELIEVSEPHFEKYKTHHCSNQHRAFSSSLSKGVKIKQVGEEIKKINWNQDIAYLIGLITTDGTLRKDRKQIKITSSNKRYLELVSDIIMGITGREQELKHEKVRFQEKIYSSYTIQFTSDAFYQFCLDIGLTSKKTYTLSTLDIPDDYFPFFLRGVIDGDGNYSFSNNNKNEVKIRIYSGSLDFLEWINETIKRLFNVLGGKFYHNENKLGSKHILFYVRVFDNLLILENIYKDAKCFHPNKFKQINHIIDNIFELKLRYAHTYVDGFETLCKSPVCQNKFIPNGYKQKYCCIGCRNKASYIRRRVVISEKSKSNK